MLQKGGGVTKNKKRKYYPLRQCPLECWPRGVLPPVPRAAVAGTAGGGCGRYQQRARPLQEQPRRHALLLPSQDKAVAAQVDTGSRPRVLKARGFKSLKVQGGGS